MDAVPLPIPEIDRISEIFANAIAPAFFLGAVAGFVSLMTARLGVVNDRIRSSLRVRPGADDPIFARLRKRARYLHDGIVLALLGGICATLLLAVMFASQFMQWRHAYGAALLFFMATLLLCSALVRFAQEAWHARAEMGDALDDIDRSRFEAPDVG